MKEKSRIDKDLLLNPLGGSGTSIYRGVIVEDYKSNLSWSEWYNIYDQMRRSDAQVFASLLVCELPIRSTQWRVEPWENKDGEIDEAAQEVANFVSNALFNKLENTWNNLLLEILTMLPFWFSVFEKIYYSDGENIFLKKLWSRKQTTIKAWETKEQTAGITQMLPQPLKDWFNKDKYEVSIPESKLLVFTNRKEWDNHEGISILRSAYKHWFYKDNLYKFDAVRHERQSVGIPVMYMPSWVSDEDKQEALTIVSNVRSTEQTGIVIPWTKEEGWLFEFADTRAGQSTDLFESINHHNREISKNVLAQFLELGNTSSGSRSLWESQSALFLLALESVAKNIADTFNRSLIPELVNLNFDTDIYPELKFQKLQPVDYEKLSNALSSLANSEIITPDSDLEAHIRKVLDLPQKIKTEGKKENTEKTKEVKKLTKDKEELKEKEKYNDLWIYKDDEYMEFCSQFDNQIILDIQKQALNKADYVGLKKKGFKFNEFESQASRPLTFAERKVNLAALNKAMNDFEKVIEKELKNSTDKIKTDLFNQIKEAVEKNDIEKIWKIRIKDDYWLADKLTEVQKAMFEIWKKSTSIEMGKKVPWTLKEVKGAMRVQNAAIVENIINDIETSVKLTVAEVITAKGGAISAVWAIETIAAVKEVLDKRIKQAQTALSSLWVSGAVNLWRSTIYEQFPKEIFAMQFSAILDGKTTHTCQSLDGRVVKPWSKEYYDYSPPRHYNCRSIWVEILKDETFKPKITGVPSSIPANKSIKTHQPLKAPILAKNSPAIKTVKKEIDDRKKKLLELEKTWKYPNRQKIHKNKIKELEKAIKKAFTNEVEKNTIWILKENGVNFK